MKLRTGYVTAKVWTSEPNVIVFYIKRDDRKEAFRYISRASYSRLSRLNWSNFDVRPFACEVGFSAVRQWENS